MRFSYLLTLLIFTQYVCFAQFKPTEGNFLKYSLAIDALDENIALVGTALNTRPSVVGLTKDGGKTWEELEYPTVNTQWITCTEIIDTTTFFISTWDTNGVEGSAKVFRTQNGGEAWDDMKIDSIAGKGVITSGLHFYNAEEGFVLHYVNSENKFAFLQTFDGGDTWIRNMDFPAESGEFMYAYNDNSCYETYKDYIWVNTLSGRIMRSKDRGTTWDTITWPLGDKKDPTSIAFRDSLNGIAVSTNNVFEAGMNGDTITRVGYRTSDGGDTWSYQAIPNDLETIEYIPNSDGVYIGTESYTGKEFYYISTDDGRTWKEQPAFGMWATAALSDTVIWAAGFVGDFNPEGSNSTVLVWDGLPLLGAPMEEIIHSVPYFENFEQDLPECYEFGGQFSLSSNAFREDEFREAGFEHSSAFAGVLSFPFFWTYTQLQTAAIQLPLDSPQELNFEAVFLAISGEEVTVAISKDEKKNWTNIYELEAEGEIEDPWYTRTVDLSEYVGEKIYLSFNYNDPNAGEGFGFAIDDISISAINMTSTFESQEFMTLEVYPNPTTDFINVKLPNLGGSLTIYSEDGKQLRPTIEINQASTQISMKDLPTGSYIIKYVDDNHITSKQIIKQ